MNFVRNVLIRNARAFADRPALIAGTQIVTHAALDARVNRAANALAAKGIGKGSVLALYAKNGLEFVDVFFASHKLGATISPINTRYKARELRHQLRDSGAELFVFDADQTAIVGEIRGELSIKTYVCIGTPTPSWAIGYERLIASVGAQEPTQVDLGPDDVATILYTSGTTGLAKAVPMRYYGGLYIGVLETNNDIGLTNKDVSLCVAPLFHQAAHGFTLLMPLSVGGTVVLHPRFEPAAVLRDVEAHGITFAFMVPTMAEAILRCPDRAQRNTKTFHKLLTSGSALMEPTKHALLAAFPGLQIWENYGATESFNTTRLLPVDVMRKQNCAGLPLPSQQVRLIDASGRDVKPGEVGEIIIKGPATFRGYLRLPPGVENPVDAQGWFHTGDLARQDDEGYYYVVGRSKDVIISGGENIYPKEIEEVISELPGIGECAVIGLPDSYWGEIVSACVVPLKPGGVPAADILAHCAKRLADYKKPRRLFFLTELPRNPAGKILRAPLADLVRDRKPDA